MELQGHDTAWGSAYEMPPAINMFKRGNRDVFIRNGTLIFLEIEAAIKRYKPEAEIGKLDVLDFGCGVGRVAMPFFHKYGRPNACVDLFKEYIDYLGKVIPGANPALSTERPPLPYGDQSFDAVYAISVWTHLNPNVGLEWLKEMARLLKPGGMALISVSSYWVLQRHHQHRELSELWKDVSAEDVKRDGAAFRTRNYGGLKEPYGETIYDHDWLRTEWGKIIPVKEIKDRAIGGQSRQDLVVMQK